MPVAVSAKFAREVSDESFRQLSAAVKIPQYNENQENKMADVLRVGILGAGWAAREHALAFSQIPDVEVSALWNRVAC